MSKNENAKLNRPEWAQAINQGRVVYFGARAASAATYRRYRTPEDAESEVARWRADGFEAKIAEVK